MSSQRTDLLILFDGECILCNSTVKFIIRNDKKRIFKFAALQSAVAKGIISKTSDVSNYPDSVILVESGKVYYKSEAILKILNLLGGVYKVFVIFKIFPHFISDKFYDVIARNRYQWFGKRDSCMVPTPEIRERFLE